MSFFLSLSLSLSRRRKINESSYRPLVILINAVGERRSVRVRARSRVYYRQIAPPASCAVDGFRSFGLKGGEGKGISVR